MSVVIESVKAREIFDSRGNPTVEADVVLSDGTLGRAEVPSGASTGEKEAVELRDGGKRLQGKGVAKAVTNVNTEINKGLHGANPFNQAHIDQLMIDLDGTPNKARLGANAILGVSMATARAAANNLHIPLYRYLGGTDLELPQTFHNVINGGEHADNAIDIQEFMITAVDRSSFRDGFEKIVNTYHTLKKSSKLLVTLPVSVTKAALRLTSRILRTLCRCCMTRSLRLATPLAKKLQSPLTPRHLIFTTVTLKIMTSKARRTNLNN